MAYSKKLNELIAYYAVVFGDNYFTYSTDWPKNLEGCRWLENNNLNFQGKKFKLEDYALNMPLFNENYELTGKHQKIITPDLPVLVVSENYKDPQINLVLSPGIISFLTQSTLSKLAKTEVIEQITVYSKEIIEYNQRLNDFVYKYAKETNPITVPFRVEESGIYTLSQAYFLEDRFAEKKEESLIPTESLLAEESIIKHNIIGLLSSIADYTEKEQQYLVPKSPKDIN